MYLSFSVELTAIYLMRCLTLMLGWTSLKMNYYFVEQFHLRPYAQLGLDRSGIPEITSRPKIIEDLITEIPEIVDASEHITQLLHHGNNIANGGSTTLQANNVVIEEPWLHETALPSCLEGITREDMEIVLLGTGSSQPSKYRNVTSIFINLFSKGSILLDCGEGTLGQLKRR